MIREDKDMKGYRRRSNTERKVGEDNYEETGRGEELELKMNSIYLVRGYREGVEGKKEI